MDFKFIWNAMYINLVEMTLEYPAHKKLATSKSVSNSVDIEEDTLNVIWLSSKEDRVLMVPKFLSSLSLLSDTHFINAVEQELLSLSILQFHILQIFFPDQQWQESAVSTTLCLA